jgi:3-oxoacyl-[acyl-carrier-protein] synthase III
MTGQYIGCRVSGIASAVPAQKASPEETAALAGVSLAETEKIIEMIGVRCRHVAPTGTCASDLCFAAAKKLLEGLEWAPETVDAVITVSQTHDYHLPATSCTLHQKLGLSVSCAAFDVALGCSGYVYGLWLCSTLIAAGSVRRVLLLAGDTSSWLCSPVDRSTVFLFGDAGSATAMEAAPDAGPSTYLVGTDGTGSEFLIVPGGAYRNRINADSLTRQPSEDGTLRGPLDLYMNGSEVFAFTLKRVPPMIKEILAGAGWNLSDIDAFVPHQANLFMLNHLAKRMRISTEKMPISLDVFGNTSCASIPLTIVHRLGSRLRQEPMRLVLAGFGVGWSWGAAALSCGPIFVPEVIYVE